MIKRTSMNALSVQDELENAKIMAEEMDCRRRKPVVVASEPGGLIGSAPKPRRKTIIVPSDLVGDTAKQRRNSTINSPASLMEDAPTLRRQSMMTPPAGLAGDAPKHRRRSIMTLPTAAPSQPQPQAAPRQRRTSMFSRPALPDVSESSQPPAAAKQRRSSFFGLPSLSLSDASESAQSQSAPRQRRASFFSRPSGASLSDASEKAHPPFAPRQRRASFFAIPSLSGLDCSESVGAQRRRTTPARSRSTPMRRKPSIVTANVRFQRIIEAMAVTEDDMKRLLDQEGGLEALKKTMKSSGVVTHSSIREGIHFFVRDCTMDWTERY